MPRRHLRMTGPADTPLRASLRKLRTELCPLAASSTLSPGERVRVRPVRADPGSAKVLFAPA